MIIKTPSALTMDFTGASPVDITNYVMAVMLDSPQSAVDDRTMGKPYATDHTVGAESITLSMKFSDAMVAQFQSYEDTDIDFVCTPVSGEVSYTATVRYSKVPSPNLTVGERAEVELVLAVVDEITATT